jgi:hypothetical protein
MILDEAVRMAADGNVFVAHEHLKQIPADSDLRKQPAFQNLEAGWADTMLQAALTEPDPAKKRAILDEVAGATDVDAERRAKASTALAALSSAAVDVAELPSGSDAVAAEPNDAPTKQTTTVRGLSPKKSSGSHIVLDEVSASPK